MLVNGLRRWANNNPTWGQGIKPDKCLVCQLNQFLKMFFIISLDIFFHLMLDISSVLEASNE